MENTNNTNREHVREIAESLELIADGDAYTCPHCGELIDRNDLPEDVDPDYDECVCPCCGHSVDLEQTDMFGWLFANSYGTTYTVDDDLDYRACRVMVACGGPNIYVDTFTEQVQLYWWGDSATYDLTRATANAIDECGEELYNSRRYSL